MIFSPLQCVWMTPFLSAAACDASLIGVWATLNLLLHPLLFLAGFLFLFLFSRDAFPVLVSIGADAFRGFPGVVQFTNQPFPKLQIIGRWAFYLAIRKSSAGKFSVDQNHARSVIELIDQRELKAVKDNVFFGYHGALTMTGDMPKLESIGVDAFGNKFSLELEDGAVEQVVILNDLPSLKRVKKSAFYGYLGNLTFSGSFPKLESIGELAFYGVKGRSVSFQLNRGAPALQCIGPKAFSDTTWTAGMALKGDFPCLLLSAKPAFDPYNFLQTARYNAGEDIFKNFSMQDHVNAGVKNCLPGTDGWCYETEASCNSIQGFAHPSQCLLQDR